MINYIWARSFIFSRSVFVLLVLVISACASNERKDSGVYKLVADADRAYLESRWLEASQLYSQIAVLVPQDHYAWFRLGNTQIREGRIESAIHSYGEALKRDPTHAKTHYNIAIAYMLIATRSMRQAAEHIRPNDPGRHVIDDKLETLQNLIDQPAETTSQVNNLPHIGQRRN